MPAQHVSPDSKSNANCISDGDSNGNRYANINTPDNRHPSNDSNSAPDSVNSGGNCRQSGIRENNS